MKSVKSRHKRLLHVKTPTGKAVRYVRRKLGVPVCADCGSILPGVARGGSMARTKKRPSRPFGGVYCSGCSRARFKAAARAE